MIGDIASVRLVVDRAPTSQASRPRWSTDVAPATDRLSVPLSFGEQSIGTLFADVQWTNPPAVAVIGRLRAAFFAIAALVGTWIAVFVFLNRRFVAPLLRRNAALERTEAVARTVQMLTHDVRKPFSKMLSGLDMIKNARSPERVRAVTLQLIPEVEGGIKAVNGMLTDIMEVGSDVYVAPATELIDPSILLRRTLEDVFRTHVDADIIVESDVRHERLISVDPLKMQRVFQNIIENAVQAMQEKGRIWVKTASVSQYTRVAIKLGNAGSFIAHDHLPRIFDAFFTKGKKGGTGLGLAIVKKIVEQHGGTITCRSEPDLGVEFTIELPAVPDGTTRAVALPLTAAAYRLVIAENTLPDSRSAEAPSRMAMSTRLLTNLRGRAAPLKILAVDDEPIYTEYLRGLIGGENDLANLVEFVSVTTASQALAKAREWHPDIAILDVDLGDPAGDGYSLSQKLRAQHTTLRVCVHSNRISSRDGAAAVAAGAEAFVPKPMLQSHFLRFLESVIAESDVAAAQSEVPPPSRPLVALVEDDIFITEAWEEALRPDAEFVAFTGPASFRRRFDGDESFRARLAAIILDNYFEGSAETGTELARSVRGRTGAAILFGSDANLDRGEISTFDAVCGKRPLPWTELNALFQPGS
jgi:signal transduction histidine kinase/ActR/RegA family two-component response regulator